MCIDLKCISKKESTFKYTAARTALKHHTQQNATQKSLKKRQKQQQQL